MLNAVQHVTKPKGKEKEKKEKAGSLEISQHAEIGIDDFFRIASVRTIELALNRLSKDEAHCIKSRTKHLAKKSFFLHARACVALFLPPTRVP